MALDEVRGTDNTYEEKEFKFVVDKELEEEVQNITVDYTSSGFLLDTEKPFAVSGNGNSCCGGDCSTGCGDGCS